MRRADWLNHWLWLPNLLLLLTEGLFLLLLAIIADQLNLLRLNLLLAQRLNHL